MRKLIYLLSFVLSLSIPTRQADAAYPFQQDSGPDGIVSMEAENYDANVSQGGHTWTLVILPAGASSSKAMQALPNDGTTRSSDYVTLSPHLDFKVSFVKTGTHYVWVRGHANGSGNDDSCHAGLDYQATVTGERISLNAAADWGWFNARTNGAPATFEVPNAGVHTINIWMREDGAIIDKIILTTNSNYQPSGKGPQESTRGNPLSVDDFEKYDVTNRIFETWIPISGTGAAIGHPASPYVEQTITYGGGKSMPFYYDNNRAGKAYYSETEADTAKLEIDPNWTKEGVKALALHFFGNPNNDANATERMYVALKDDANKMAVAYYDGDPDDVREEKWHEWNIRLRDFTDSNSVNLINVKKVCIGFGTRGNRTTLGGSGLVYFDDIRLYPPRCVPSRVKGNFNDDCVVDYADLEIITAHWLNDYQFEDFASLADSWLDEILWPQ
jgi:hypothetical protein